MSKKRVLADDDLRDIVDSHIAQKKKASSSVKQSPTSNGGGMNLPDGLSEEPTDFNFSEESAGRPIQETPSPGVELQLGNAAPDALGYRDAGLNAAAADQLGAQGDYQSPVAAQQSQQLAQANSANPVNAIEAHKKSSQQSLLTNNSERPLWQKVTDFIGLPEFNQGVSSQILDVADAGATVVDDAIGGVYTAVTGKPYTSQKGNIFKEWSDGYKKDIERVTPMREGDASTVRDVYSGLIETAPLIFATTMTGGENLAADAPQAISHLTKFLAATGALKGYGEARHNDEDIKSSIQAAAKGGVKGATEGITLDAMMLVGKAAGKGATKILADRGLLVGGEITKKALDAIGVGSAFAGSAIGQNVLDGDEIDWRNAKKQFGMGISFEASPVLKAAGNEVAEGVRSRRIDNGIIKNIADNRNEAKILNFIKATPEQIDGIFKMPKSADELFADATEIGIKAGESSDVKEKTNGYLSQIGLINASDIKSVAEDITKDPGKFIDAISQSDLSDQVKSEILAKVTQVHKNYNPTEQVKTALGEQITGAEDLAKTHEDIAKHATDPVTQIESEVMAKNASSTANESKKELTKVVEEQLKNEAVGKQEQMKQHAVDLTVADFQTKFPDSIPDPLSEIPESAVKTMNRVDADKPTDLIAVNEASDALYDKYKQLSAMKKSDSRLLTIDQINDAQDMLEQDITMLENHKQKYHADETDTKQTTEPPTLPIENEKVAPEIISNEQAPPKEQFQEDKGVEGEQTTPQDLPVSELEPPKSYGYEDIDGMTDVKEVADNFQQEVLSPTEVSPKEQAIKDAGGFTTTPESYAQFGDRNNQGDQMAKSYFRKKGLPLDKIAASLSKEGLEITPADLKDYMEKFPDGNTTYSGRAKALQEKLFDMTGKKYNKSTVENLRERLETNAIKKIEENPDVLDEKTLSVIEEEGVTAQNIDSLEDKITFIFGKDVFNNIKDYLNGEEPGQSVSGTSEERGKNINESGNESIPEKERGVSSEGEAEPTVESTRSLEEVNSDYKGLVKSYQDVLRERNLFDLAKNGLADPVDIEMARMDAEAEFGKTAKELIAEREYLESKKNEETIIPTTEGEPAGETTEGTDRAEAEQSQAEAEKEAPVTDESKPEEISLSDKIRSLKSGRRGQLNDGLLGVGIAFYDGALETIATAIEAGATIAEALRKGIDYITKNTDVKDEAAIEAQFIKELEDAGLIIPGLKEENPIPEIVNEIEKSPEDITAESITDFKKRLDRVLKNARTQSLIKSGMVKSDMAFKAVKLVADIVDHKSMLEAGRAVRKMFANVVENAYRSQLAKAKEGIKVRLKGSKLAKTDLLKKFLSINDRGLSIPELEEYNMLARKLNDQYNARLESVVSDTDLQKFVDKIADKKAKEILDKQLDGEVIEELEDVEPGESPRRKQLNAAVTINRQELKSSSYSDKYKDVAKSLLRIDTESLSNKDLRDLNMALINLAVNDRLVGHEKIFKEYTGQKGLEVVNEQIGNKVRGILNNLLGASARTLDVNSKIIFKGIKDTALFQHLTGVAGISNGNSKVANIDMKSFSKDYIDFIDKQDFPEANSSENRFLRGMYSAVTQFSSIDSEGKDYKRYKSLVEQSAEKLSNSKDPVEQREGQLRSQQFEEYLKPFDTRSEFEDNFKKLQPKNEKIVQFFREKFADKFPELQSNTQIYGGKSLKEVNNYLPMSWKTYSGTEIRTPGELNEIIDPVFDFDPETGDVSERQSSTTIERTNKNKIKDTDRILNMDFDRFIFDKYREMNYDIRTLRDRHLYNSIKSQEGFGEVVGGVKNAEVLTSGVRNMVKRQMGGSLGDPAIRPVLEASRILSGKGVRQALFGATQVLKQYPSVAVRTMANLNTDVGLFFRGVNVGKDNPIFDNFGIGLRGSTKGGTNFELELNRIRKSDFSSSPGKLKNALNRVSKSTADALSKPLSYSDDAVAKHSWIAYYLQHIRDNGGDINKIDWENEHLNPDQAAGSYADLMVSTTQNVNDNSKQANLLYDNNDAKTIVRDIIAPFSSFARNSQANLEADLRTFSGGTAAEKKLAAWGIISNVSEQIAFNSIKVLVVGALINKGSEFLLDMLGYDFPKKDPLDGAGAKIAKNSVSDILFGGTGQLASYWAIKGINQVDKAVNGSSEDLFFQYNPAQYGDPDFGAAGIYGILPQNIYNAAQKADYLDGVLTGYYKKKGQEYKSTVNLSPKDQAVVSTLFMMDALSIAGLSDAELSRLNQTMFRKIKTVTAPVKKFTIESKNSKADPTVEEINNEEETPE